MTVPGVGVRRIVPFGDSAVLVSIEGPAGPATARRARAIAAMVATSAAAWPGWGHPVPGGSSVLVPVDPVQPGVARAIRAIRRLLAEAARLDPDLAVPGPLVEIPVVYGGDWGPDLSRVAERAGLSTAAVVELHAATTYEVLFLGFAPGFAYLGPLDGRLILPRLETPRVRVPGGSVAIAGEQTAVYPSPSPGGWWILGRTTTRLWDPTADRPARLAAGDRVRFVPLVGPDR